MAGEISCCAGLPVLAPTGCGGGGNGVDLLAGLELALRLPRKIGPGAMGTSISSWASS